MTFQENTPGYSSNPLLGSNPNFAKDLGLTRSDKAFSSHKKCFGTVWISTCWKIWILATKEVFKKKNILCILSTESDGYGHYGSEFIQIVGYPHNCSSQKAKNKKSKFQVSRTIHVASVDSFQFFVFYPSSSRTSAWNVQDGLAVPSVSSWLPRWSSSLKLETTVEAPWPLKDLFFARFAVV